MIIEISIAVIALAFVILVIALIVTLKSVHRLLNQFDQALSQTRKQVQDLGSDAKKIVEITTQLSTDLQKKVETFNPIFRSVENFGLVLENKSAEFKRDFMAGNLKTGSKAEHIAPFVSAAAQKPLSSIEESTAGEGSTEYSIVRFIADIFELTGLGLRLWQKIKKRR